MNKRTPSVLVVGSGPAGLMAADVISAAGIDVVLAEAKPSFGRKFLMAGKSGLNITKDEPMDRFLAAYGTPGDAVSSALADFGPEAVMRWAESLGQPIFTGSSRRVFPTAMKASPLLRAWLARLVEQGVDLRSRWRWTGPGVGRGVWRFETADGPCEVAPRATVLALGGASWARLGSDGAWAAVLRDAGVALAPFRPANMGFTVDWSPHMAPVLGRPVKNVGLTAGGRHVRGEFMLSARGIEGSAVYDLSRAMRGGAELTLDLTPDRDLDALTQLLTPRRRGRTLSERLRRDAGLDATKRALLQEFARPLPAEAGALAALIKALPVRHGGPRPIDEAISTAGGVALSGCDAGLMLTAWPGVFCAGEMLDWEAPTGGYLITAALATGRAAGHATLAHLGR